MTTPRRAPTTTPAMPRPESEPTMTTMKSFAWSWRVAPLTVVVGAALVVLTSARAARADEDDTAVLDASTVSAASDDEADAGGLQLQDGVIHLDGATGDAAADKADQSGCAASGTSDASFWWLPLPITALFLAAARRRRGR